MPDFAEPLSRLIDEFKHLPGIGQKSAQRIAFHLLRTGRDHAERLSQAIAECAVSTITGSSAIWISANAFAELTGAGHATVPFSLSSKARTASWTT